MCVVGFEGAWDQDTRDIANNSKWKVKYTF